MLVELRSKSQITIPNEVTKNLDLKEGDKFEIIVKDGGIYLCPVVVYSKEKMKKIANILKEVELEKDNMKSYDDIDQMFSDMGIDTNEFRDL